MKYSFVLPTKNRAQLVGGAIESILSQTLSDFEIIIIDNDDSNDTKNVVSKFKDERIKYVRTGGLGMPQNWKRALSESNGEWTIFVEDKFRMKRNCLETLEYFINQIPAQCYSWLATPDGRDHLRPDFYSAWITAENLNSVDSIMEIVNGKFHKYWDKIPKLLNSAIHRELIKKIDAQSSQALCAPVCPDFTSAFSILLNCERYVHVKAVLSTIAAGAPSQGEATGKLTKDSYKLFSDAGLKVSYSYDIVPAKYHSLRNTVYNDFLNCLQRFDKMENFPINKTAYYIQLSEELRLLAIENIDVQDMKKSLKQSFYKESFLTKIGILYRELIAIINPFYVKKEFAFRVGLLNAFKRLLILNGI
jgi:glycosyltransferase involved in cell wall biosynthesis